MSDVGSRILSEPVHLPFAEHAPDAAFRWRLGVRPLDPSAWFEWGSSGEAAVAAKPPILAEHGDTVFAVLDDGVEEVGAELSTMIVGHLAEHAPMRSRSIDSSLHPLDAAARLVPDDLVVLVEREGRLVFGGGSLCFPNRWDLRSKLGLTMAEVHAPVGLLNEQIERPIDHFFERLVPERSWWRLGWGIIDSDDWYAPPLSAAGSDPEPSGWLLRVERETLRRLPQTQAVAFGIRTHLTPLGALTAEQADHLASRVERLPEEVAAYKSLDGVRGEVLALLRSA